MIDLMGRNRDGEFVLKEEIFLIRLLWEEGGTSPHSILQIISHIVAYIIHHI